MTQWFKTNLTLKLVSLLLAVVLWAFIKALIAEPPPRSGQPSGSVFQSLGLVKQPTPVAPKPARTNVVSRPSTR